MDQSRESVGRALLPEGVRGSPPTTPTGESSQPAARTRLYRQGRLVRQNFPVDEISQELTDEEGCVVWLDLCQPDSGQLEVIRSEFGLHELSIEDALGQGQRTKIDRYRNYLFMSAYSAALDKDSGKLVAHEISAFITRHALITVRKDPDFDIDPVVARWDMTEDLAEHGVAFLLHGLLDHLVDGHFHAVESLDEAVEETEDSLFDSQIGTLQLVRRRSFQLRKSLVLMRRITLPTREVVNTLMRHDLHIVDESMVPYFQDIYDHVIRATEWTESLRDLVTTIVETNLTEQGNRLNTITKKVTSWAAIIAVPTLITGWYGMNVPYPGSGKTVGVITASLLIIVGATSLFVLFRRKGWL